MEKKCFNVGCDVFGSGEQPPTVLDRTHGLLSWLNADDRTGVVETRSVVVSRAKIPLKVDLMNLNFFLNCQICLLKGKLWVNWQVKFCCLVGGR